MMRFDDWPERLARFLEARRDAPFAWGKNDCGLFVADAVLEMTGVDMAVDFRETSPAKLKRMARRIEQITEAKAAEFGLREIAPRFARRGDIAFFPGPVHGPAILLVDARFLLGPSDHGWVRLPLSAASRAWRVE